MRKAGPLFTRRLFRCCRALAVAACLAAVPSVALAQDASPVAPPSPDVPWGQFQGTSEHQASVDTWSDPGLAEEWHASVPGAGASGPVVALGTVFVVARDNVVGIDLASGGIRWQAPRTPGPVTSPAIARVEDDWWIIYMQGAAEESQVAGLKLDDRGELIAPPRDSKNDVTGTSERQKEEPAPSHDGRSPSPSPGEGSADAESPDAESPAEESAGVIFAELDAPSFSGISVEGEIAMVGDFLGGVYAIDLIERDKLWKRPLGQPPMFAPPVISQGVTYVTDVSDATKARLIAVDVADGEVRFEQPLGPAGTAASMTVEGDTVYAAFNDRTVRAYATVDGAPRWSTSVLRASIFREVLAVGPTSSPAYRDGTLIVTGPSGGVYALDAATGSLRWDFQITDALIDRSAPVIAGDIVYVGTAKGGVVAIRISDGRQVFRIDRGSGSVKPLALADGHLIAGAGGDGGVVAYRQDAGARLTDIESSTKLNLSKMLPPFIGALVLVAAVALALGAGIRRLGGRQRAGGDDGNSKDDDDNGDDGDESMSSSSPTEETQ